MLAGLRRWSSNFYYHRRRSESEPPMTEACVGNRNGGHEDESPMTVWSKTWRFLCDLRPRGGKQWKLWKLEIDLENDKVTEAWIEWSPATAALELEIVYKTKV